jgi:hypothetical protein
MGSCQAYARACARVCARVSAWAHARLVIGLALGFCARVGAWAHARLMPGLALGFVQESVHGLVLGLGLPPPYDEIREKG